MTDALPDGTPFPFWDDETEYQHTYHVARNHPGATDEGSGTEDEPFETIQAAADRLEPGEEVVVHEGVYRERVSPVRGGESTDQMIAYRAAPGEDVVVSGSRVWEPDLEPSSEWDFGDPPEGATVWTSTFPKEWFEDYHPFAVRNVPTANQFFLEPAAEGAFTESELRRLMARRGTVYVDGDPLDQVYYPPELGDTDGAFWVEQPGSRIHFRLPDDVDPESVKLEVTVQEQVFAPRETGIGYVCVSGFTFEHAADGIPVPQRAMLSANCGHHWIIENNRVRWANAYGIDVGNRTWHRDISEVERDEQGHHVIRGNHVSDCGACGIAAVNNNRHTLVEDNLVERIGSQNLERIWETAGLKFHVCDGVLIRENVFRHIDHASGVWLDYLNENTRVTHNVIADVESVKSGIYLEVSQARNLIDHNVVWDVRGDDQFDDSETGEFGHGIYADTGEGAVVANNLVGRVPDGFAVAATLDQADRVVGDQRVGLCRDHVVCNNVITECPRRVLLGRRTNNRVDGNLYDVDDDSMSLRVTYPEPPRQVDLDAWRDHLGYDEHGTQTTVEVDFDPESADLAVDLGETTDTVSVPGLEAVSSPGPVDLDPGSNRIKF